MSLYVIRREDGQYVTRTGSEHSYTRKLEKARTFTTRADAERERCPENERVCSVESLIESAD